MYEDADGKTRATTRGCSITRHNKAGEWYWTEVYETALANAKVAAMRVWSELDASGNTRYADEEGKPLPPLKFRSRKKVGGKKDDPGSD